MLGLPLANPARRLWAMAIDLLLVAVLVKSGGVFLGVAATFLLFRASRSSATTGFVRSGVRNALRLGGAILLFIVIVNVWSTLKDKIAAREKTPTTQQQDDEQDTGDLENLNIDIPPGKLRPFLASLASLRGADDSTEVADAATKLLTIAKESGASTNEMYEARSGLIEVIGSDADSSKIAAVGAAIRKVAGPPPEEALPADTLLREIQGLKKENARLTRRNNSLNKKLEDAEKAHGIRSFLAGAADDLGVGFGWSAVYFTAFLAMWSGLTPGKKLAGVRVMRLDGKPLGWWMSFERFGGYAASFSVGLLGFAQILWDRNRQGLHDKACETVVVLDKRARSNSREQRFRSA